MRCYNLHCTIVIYIANKPKYNRLKTEEEYILFLAEHRNSIYRIALGVVMDSNEAEDIVQDVLEQVWSMRDRVLQSAYPRAYIFRITHNLAIDRQRRASRRRIFSINEQMGGEQNSGKEIDISDIANITRRIIASLPEKQRLAIHLRDVEGYEIEEIAEALETDETNVRMNLSRARKSVREELIKTMNYGVGKD